LPNSDSPIPVVRFRLGQYFTKGSHKVAMSVPELVAQTNSFSTKNRPGCTPKLQKSNPKELFLDYNVTCTLPESDPKGHNVKVHFDLSQVKDDTTAKNLDVAVSCSCAAFLYYGAQWNLHQRDALEGEPRPLLTAPTERLDLRDGFILCKHLKAVSERILPSVQHNITKVLRDREMKRVKEEEKEKKPPRGLTLRQKNLRQRQQQPALDRDQEIKDKLLRGLEQREGPTPESTPEVVIRDTPATPEERERLPVLPEEVLKPILDPIIEPAPAAEEELEPIPEIEGLEDEQEPPPSAPEEREEERYPQTLPQMTKEDREYMRRLMREKQGK